MTFFRKGCRQFCDVIPFADTLRVWLTQIIPLPIWANLLYGWLLTMKLETFVIWSLRIQKRMTALPFLYLFSMTKCADFKRPYYLTSCQFNSKIIKRVFYTCFAIVSSKARITITCVSIHHILTVTVMLAWGWRALINFWRLIKNSKVFKSTLFTTKYKYFYCLSSSWM